VSNWQTAGMTLGYDDLGGEGADPDRAVVLIHGHPFDRSMWRPQAAFLAGLGYRVIAPDLRGYGTSSVHSGICTLDVFATDIAGLLDVLGIGAAVICGLSMGGQIALEFARLHSGRVRALVLADTSAPAETGDGIRRRHATADRLLAEGMAGYAAEVLPHMLSPQSVTGQPAVAAHVLNMMRAASPAGAAAALRGRAARPDYVAMLSRITVPVLVVVGSADEYTPLPDATLIADGIPGASLSVIEGAGHLPNLERPDAFNEALGRFLETITAARGCGV
jgi:pimeloyl-ACP methyl ester carboxylesterase